MTELRHRKAGVSKRPARRYISLALSFSGALFFAFCVPAEAQQRTGVARVGWLDSGSTDRGSRLGELFLHSLSELGYVDGKNIAFEFRSADKKLEQLPAMARELVGLKVDVLVTVATPAAVAAKNATKTIPIVFIVVADPVEAGLINNLARPGGNITGLTNIAAVLAGNDWSCSRKPFLNSPALRYCGIRRIQALRKHGKKANFRHEH